MKFFAAAILFVLSIAVRADATAPVRPGSPLANPVPCAEAPTFTCSFLTVPLDRSGRVPGTLRLRVAVETATDAPRGTLMLLSGGPGQPGPSLLPRLLPRFHYLLDDYRLVMIDQRGTGPGAIDCPRVQQEMGFSDVVPASRAAIEECATILGETRNFYTTADTVSDLDDLRQALGVHRWTLDGVSYGSFVAAHYGLTHPQHVERLVLDSIVPHTGATTLFREGFSRVAWFLRTACAEQSCGFDPAAELETVLRNGFRAVDVFDLLIIASIADPKLTGKTFFPVLNLIHTAAQGNTAPLRQAVEALQSGPPAPADFSTGLHIATICADATDAPWGDSSAPIAGRDAALAAAVAKVSAQEVWPFQPQHTAEQGIAAVCQYWPSSRPNPQPRHRRLTMPVLILAGDRDLSTPVVWAHEIAAIAPRGKLVVIAGAGHSLQGRNTEADQAVRKFLLC